MFALRSSVVAGALFAAVTSWAAPAAAAINAGDRINVHVFNHPELSILATVDSRGTIELPVVGRLHVLGLESADVAALIRRRIDRYVSYPSVDVQDTTESQMLFVSGGPGGVLPYAPNETLASAVAEVAKVTQSTSAPETQPNAPLDRFDHSRLDLKRITVIRGGRVLGVYDLMALRNAGLPGPTLFANDTVAFANKPISISVVGAANTAGPAYLWPDEPLSDALAQAGGPASVAATGHIQVARAGAPPRTVALGDAMFNAPAQMGDIVTIPTAPRVTVAGLVEHPGVVTLTNDFSLISALAAAGGYNKFSDLRKVQILHAGVRSQFNIVRLAHGDLTQNPLLSDGDTVYVPEGYKTDWAQVFQGLGGLSGFGVLLTHL